MKLFCPLQVVQGFSFTMVWVVFFFFLKLITGYTFLLLILKQNTFKNSDEVSMIKFL